MTASRRLNAAEFMPKRAEFRPNIISKSRRAAYRKGEILNRLPQEFTKYVEIKLMPERTMNRKMACPDWCKISKMDMRASRKLAVPCKVLQIG
jgi:hypothetical protein